jgi:hypothetical protein
VKPARALRHATTMMLLAVLGLPVSAAGQDESARIAHGIAVYLGVVPAAMIRGHPADQPERAMHGGIPRGRDSHHVTVALFDAQSGRRIETAAVQAYVALRGSRGTTRQLETMRIADTVTFGNYFNLRGEGVHDIEITITLPGADEPVTVQFSHPPPSR